MRASRVGGGGHGDVARSGLPGDQEPDAGHLSQIDDRQPRDPVGVMVHQRNCSWSSSRTAGQASSCAASVPACPSLRPSWCDRFTSRSRRTRNSEGWITPTASDFLHPADNLSSTLSPDPRRSNGLRGKPGTSPFRMPSGLPGSGRGR